MTAPRELSALLPCPFCGSAAPELVDASRAHDAGEYVVVCYACGADGGYHRDTRDEAVAVWNTRADMPARVESLALELETQRDITDREIARAERLEHELAAALAARAVPREPTAAMIRAGVAAWERAYPCYTIDGVGDTWRAMWDVAPLYAHSQEPSE